MIKCVAVFRSKTDLFTFTDTMQYMGVMTETVATPKEARVGCGLSARFDERFYGIALKVIKSGDYRSFYAIFKVKTIGSRITTVRIYP